MTATCGDTDLYAACHLTSVCTLTCAALAIASMSTCADSRSMTTQLSSTTVALDSNSCREVSAAARLQTYCVRFRSRPRRPQKRWPYSCTSCRGVLVARCV